MRSVSFSAIGAPHCGHCSSIIHPLFKFFTALIAEHGIREIHAFAVRAIFFFGFLFYRLSAFSTKAGAGRNVFSAVRALSENDQLVSAAWTKSGIFVYSIAAIGTFA